MVGCEGVTEPEPDPDPDPDPVEFSGQLAYEEVANFGTMMSYGTAPEGDSRFFVSELAGRVWIIEDGEVHDEPFLDISDVVSVGVGERGFLGMTFHPRFPSEPYFYVNYTTDDGHNQIQRFTVSPTDPNRIDRASRHHIMTIEQPNAYHNGGELVFGPDEMLYVALGDGSVGYDQAGHGQNPHTLLASMLRIDVINGDPYGIPPDNPFADGEHGAPEVWHYGLRHAWRFDFDREANLLYLPDVGEDSWEEVNVVPADEGGHNFGWAVAEGPDCFGGDDCDLSGITMPVLWYGPEDGCAVIGGFVYRGEAMPVLQGRYFFADHCQKWVRAIRYENEEVVEDDTWTANLWQIPEQINSFGRDGNGELYLLTRNGSVMKIVEAEE